LLKLVQKSNNHPPRDALSLTAVGEGFARFSNDKSIRPTAYLTLYKKELYYKISFVLITTMKIT
jgi:hypothetical protein